jgi:hypothetical protein
MKNLAMRETAGYTVDANEVQSATRKVPPHAIDPAGSARVLGSLAGWRRAESKDPRESMNRATLKYLILLALAIALFYWKTLLTNQFTMLLDQESVNYTYSWLRFWVSSLREGRLPLWDPYVFCGRPFAGEMLPSAFYPLHLPFLLVPFNRHGLFSVRLYHEAVMLIHLLGAYFTFALIREFRLSRFAAFVSACAFALCSILSRMLWPPFLEAEIWLPAIFLFLVRALSTERAGSAVLEASLSGLCLGMSILTGGLHFSIMQGIFVVTAVLYYGMSSPAPAPLSRRSHWLRVALILAVVLAVAGGIGAVQLLPAHEYSTLSLRFIDGGPVPANEKIPYHRLHPGTWPRSIVSTLFPYGFEQQIGGGEAWTIYVGVFPLFLAITAIWKCWSILWVRYLTGLAVLSFVYSLGELSLLHGVLYALVPYLWVVRISGRFIYLASFALAILAAFGMDSLLDRVNPNSSWAPAKRFLKWVAIACASALFVPAIFSQPQLGIWNSLSLLLILSSCGIFAYLTTHDASPSVKVLLAAFILFDLSAFQWLETNKTSPSKPTEQLDQMISLGGVANFLKTRPELGRVRVEVSPEPNIGDAYGVHAHWGGGGTLLTSYSRLRPHDDLLNVRYIVKRAAVGDPEPVYEDAHWKIYQNPTAYPRAWLVHQVVVEESQEAVYRRFADPAIDFRQVALLEAPLPQALQGSAGTTELVRFRSYEGNRIVVEATAESNGLVVFSEMYYPGWRATMNGEPTEIYRVNGGLRGVLVPRGESRITLEYAPFSVYAGGAVTLLTFLGVLSALVLSRWKRGALRHRADAATAP